MASALCTRCSAEFHWEARRGMRLANVVSPCCGAAGGGFRYDRRRSVFATIERHGSLGPRGAWRWTASGQAIYLLADGRVQLENRVIYRPEATVGDSRYFVYAGRDPHLAEYRMRMAERTYRELVAGGAVSEAYPRPLPTLLTEGSAGHG